MWGVSAVCCQGAARSAGGSPRLAAPGSPPRSPSSAASPNKRAPSKLARPVRQGAIAVVITCMCSCRHRHALLFFDGPFAELPGCWWVG